MTDRSKALEAFERVKAVQNGGLPSDMETIRIYLTEPAVDAALRNVITAWGFDNGYDFVDSEVSDLVNRITTALKGQSK